jgi:serine/threonine protein kinase
MILDLHREIKNLTDYGDKTVCGQLKLNPRNLRTLTSFRTKSCGVNTRSWKKSGRVGKAKFFASERETGVKSAPLSSSTRHATKRIKPRGFTQKAAQTAQLSDHHSISLAGVALLGRPAVFVLISEYVEGETLTDFIERQPGKRLHPYLAVSLLYELAKGFEPIHQLREYHGDIHSGNVLVERAGIRFQLKVLDFFKWDDSRPENILDDVVFLIRLFYDALGGEAAYPKMPAEIKDICCGLKRSLIEQKFRNARQLRLYLEQIQFRPPKRRR